jgi:hypothetical protein
MGGLTPEQEVLERSGRRCCLCYGLYGSLEVKHGQIAHLDGNRDNNNVRNLAFLCFEHHDEFDSTPSQSKGWTIKEAKRYRTMLYETIEGLRSSAKQSVTKTTGEYALPIWGRIAAGNDIRMILDAIDKNTGQQYYSVRACSLLYGGSLVFDITNPNEMDMRIIEIYVDVIRFIPIDIVGVWEGDKGGGMMFREYGCDIESDIRRYRCFQISEGFDYIRLSPGEMESFRVYVVAEQEGIYQMRLAIKYSIGGDMRIHENENALQEMGFFDPVFHTPSHDFSEREINKEDQGSVK